MPLGKLGGEHGAAGTAEKPQKWRRYASQLYNMPKYPSLFQAASDWHNNACLNFSDDPSYGYIKGYLRAGEILCDFVNQEGTHQDTLVFPIIFLFRHHLEIRLKETIKKARLILDDGNDYKSGHSLEALWKECKPLLIRVWKDQKPPEDMQLIDHVISEIHLVDAQSHAFRYWESTDKQGRKENLENIKYINIRHFRDHMSTVTNFLDGVSSGLGSLLDGIHDER